MVITSEVIFVSYVSVLFIKNKKSFREIIFLYIFATKNYGVIVLRPQTVSKRESGGNPELYP